MQLTRTILIAALLFPSGSLLAEEHGAKPDNQTQPAPSLVTREPSPSYRLRTGDQIEVSFALSPDFDQTLYVLPDGFISLREAPPVRAEGLTLPEVSERIKQTYAGILHKPVITVVVKDFEKPSFTANGQLGKPGKYDLRGRVTVAEAVAIAGGLTTSSKHSQVVLFRRLPNGLTEAHLIDLKHQLASRDLSEDLILRDGDMVYVPQNAFSKYSRYLPTTSMGAYPLGF